MVYEVKCTLNLFYITFHYSDKFILKVKPYSLTTLFAYDLVCPMANAFSSFYRETSLCTVNNVLCTNHGSAECILKKDVCLKELQHNDQIVNGMI